MAAPQPSPPLVEVKHVAKVYEPHNRWMSLLMRSQVAEPVHALVDVTFEVRGGEACVVVGPNGAGKSTLFRILTGLTTPTTGSASVMGFDVEHQAQKLRHHVGFMPADDRSLLLRHTCRQNLYFHGRLQAIPKRELASRIDEVLDMVGLSHARDRAGFALSNGMRARLQLARALLHSPRILILDEPTGAIDPVDAQHLLELIQRLTHEQQLAVLISSHRLEEIDALSDNIAFLDHGHLVHWGDLASLRSIWEVPRILVAVQGEDLAEEVVRKLEEAHDIGAEVDRDGNVVVATSLAVGDVLERLGPLLAHVTAVSESRLPLREVMALLLNRSRAA